MTHPRADKAWVGVPTFLRAPLRDPEALEPGEADIGVLGIPFDEGSPFLTGTRMGPRALREHSLRFGSKSGFFDIESGATYLAREIAERRIVDLGDADILPTNAAESFDAVTRSVRRALDAGLFPVSLGGDHTVSYPVVRAFDGPIHIVHFDAHLDYGAPNRGMVTNGMPFRLIHRMPTVTGLTQIGIRSLRNLRSDYEDAVAAGSRIVPMGELRGLLAQGGAESVAALVPEDARVYVSIDVDALDGALIPGCVSAEPNGMSYAELRDVFAAVARRNEIVGFDFVEVCPPLDVGTGVTAYLGAHLVVECLGIVCNQPWWHRRVGFA